MYYYLFPFIYKKINNEFYYLNERENKNKLVRTVLEYHRLNTKMSLSILMGYGNYELIDFIEKNKPMINEYFEYLIKE